MRTSAQEDTTDQRATSFRLELLDARHRGRLYTLVSLVLISAVFAVGAIRWVDYLYENGGPVGLFTQTDFPGVIIGSRLVASGHGAQLYNLDLQLKEQQQLRAQGYLSLSIKENQELKYPYPYTPFLAVLWSPLTGLPPLTQMALWDLLNIAAMAWGMWFLLSSLPLANTTRLLLLLAALTSFPFIQNLEQGQSSGIIVFSLATSIALLRRGEDLPAGLVLGLLVLKVQWLPFISLVLIWKRRWTALAGLAATGLALLLLAAGTMGMSWLPDYLGVLQQAQHFSRAFLLDPWYSHSLSGGLAALLGGGNETVIGWANTAATFLGALLLLLVWRGKWQAASAPWVGRMALVILASMFVDLQLNTHDLSLLVLPGALGIAYFAGQNRERAIWYGLLWAAYFVSAAAPFTQPIRLTTLTMLLMLGYLVVKLISSRQESRSPAEAGAA